MAQTCWLLIFVVAHAGSPFERPSAILLRQKVAAALEVHWERLEHLITFGLSCSTRMARLTVVRMLTRMAGLGAGLAPLLGAKVCVWPRILAVAGVGRCDACIR